MTLAFFSRTSRGARWRQKLLLALGLVLLLAACALLPSTSATPTPIVPSPTPTATAQATPTSTPVPFLRVWLPPELGPDTPGWEILLARLQEAAAAEGLALDWRIKAPEGPGGALPTLDAALVVAPGAVPDLILLPREALEVAALKGLLQPLEGLPQAPPPNLPYAQALGEVQGVQYGYLFAGQAFALLYAPEVLPQPPTTWAAIYESNLPLRWAAGDPRARLLLGLYRSAGGAFRDAAGRPTLDPNALQVALEPLARLAQRGQALEALLDLSTDDALWRAYGEAPQALLIGDITPSLRSETWLAVPIPGLETASPWAWGDGYLWAVPMLPPERTSRAARVLAWLSQPDFVGRWTEAAGYLPPSRAALEAWQNPTQVQPLLDVLQVAQRLPERDVLETLGPLFQQALSKVLRGEQTPASAAQAAYQALGLPTLTPTP